jgi:hypothetical protein
LSHLWTTASPLTRKKKKKERKSRPFKEAKTTLQRCPTSTTTSLSPQSANGTTTTSPTIDPPHTQAHAKPQSPSTRPPSHPCQKRARHYIQRNASEHTTTTTKTPITTSTLPTTDYYPHANPQQWEPPAKSPAQLSYHATSAIAAQPRSQISIPSPGVSRVANRRALYACANASSKGLYIPIQQQRQR